MVKDKKWLKEEMRKFSLEVSPLMPYIRIINLQKALSLVDQLEEPTPYPYAPKKVSDNLVNNPFHYNIGGIETIDIIKSTLTEQEFKGYLKGNILKYRERANHKGNAEQDYAKARKYYEWLEELEK